MIALGCRPPTVGERVLVRAYRTGRLVRSTPGIVTDRRGGVARRVGKKTLPPRIVECLVDGFQGWYKWFQLDRVAS